MPVAIVLKMAPKFKLHSVISIKFIEIMGMFFSYEYLFIVNINFQAEVQVV